MRRRAAHERHGHRCREISVARNQTGKTRRCGVFKDVGYRDHKNQSGRDLDILVRQRGVIGRVLLHNALVAVHNHEHPKIACGTIEWDHHRLRTGDTRAGRNVIGESEGADQDRRGAGRQRVGKVNGLPPNAKRWGDAHIRHSPRHRDGLSRQRLSGRRNRPHAQVRERRKRQCQWYAQDVVRPGGFHDHPVWIGLKHQKVSAGSGGFGLRQDDLLPVGVARAQSQRTRGRHGQQYAGTDDSVAP